MNFIDVIIIIPVLWFAYKGFTKGFVIEAASVAALLLGIFIANEFSHFLADILNDNFDMDPEHVHLVAFALTFIGVVIGVHFVAKMVDKLVKSVALGTANRIAGGAFGIAKVVFIMSVLFVVLGQIDKDGKYLSEDNKKNSLLYEPVYKVSLEIFPSLESDVRTVKEVNDAREEISGEEEEDTETD